MWSHQLSTQPSEMPTTPVSRVAAEGTTALPLQDDDQYFVALQLDLAKTISFSIKAEAELAAA